MYAVSDYEKIEKREKEVEGYEIVVLLFVRPSETDILNEFEYIHYNSYKYCSIYAIGYSEDKEDETYREIGVKLKNTWYYSPKRFAELKNQLEARLNWNYSGEVELLILQNSHEGRSSLNFRNYISINVDKGIREGYIDSFQNFMETLIRISREKVTATEVVHDLFKSRISIKDILVDVIENIKRVPKPIKKILKDRLFYRPANTFKKC